MASRPRNAILTDALVIMRDCKRFLVVIHEDVRIEMQDDEPARERSAVELLDAYIGSYMNELIPHLQKVAKLKRLSLSIKQLQSKPRLP